MPHSPPTPQPAAESASVLLDPRYPAPHGIADYQRNLAAVRARIAAACQRVGRNPAEVRLLPVSKTKSEAEIRIAYAAGCRELGENKVQEATRKQAALADLADLRWSVIGHLQTNKARWVAQHACEFQALDSFRVAETLHRHLQPLDRQLDVYVQINTSGEASKYGLAPADAAAFVRELSAWPTLRVRGLMTLAVLSSDPQQVRACFVLLRQLRDQLREQVPNQAGLQELSMGMSGDYEIAVEEGATVVRVGQAIFGARALPDSHFWPGNAG